MPSSRSWEAKIRPKAFCSRTCAVRTSASWPCSITSLASATAKGPRAGFAKRAAINAPIQGTAADIIRRAMIQMPQAIAHLPATMLLQVHDELLFEVSKEAAGALIIAAKQVMEAAAEPIIQLDVPLIVEAGQGSNWAAAH